MVGVELFPNPLQVVPIFGDVYGVGAFAANLDELQGFA